MSGRGRELERTFNEFILAFLLSIVFMYMILASQFESVIHPVTILLSLPLAVPFALISLSHALLNHFGPEVQLSNIRIEELLRVEIYRRGLHSDAFQRGNLRPRGPAR